MANIDELLERLQDLADREKGLQRERLIRAAAETLARLQREVEAVPEEPEEPKQPQPDLRPVLRYIRRTLADRVHHELCACPSCELPDEWRERARGTPDE